MQSFDIFRAVEVLDPTDVQHFLSIGANGTVTLSVPRTRQDRSYCMKVSSRHPPTPWLGVQQPC